jgi:indolepyruvate ferredoxin oxidoreductase alpha subunit
MSGNEAAARGAYDAGVSFAAAYPGTPSTEILESIALYKDDVMAEWAPNEKVALESAIGASIAGARALSAMKMVGVNVAADPLFSYAYCGVNGGLVLVSADDPSLHSSQNEQDNRFYAPFAKIPMLEPSDSQECYEMMRSAYAISESFDTPVLFRMTTRVCHSKSLVTPSRRSEVPLRPYVKNLDKFDLVPAVSRRLRLELEARMEKLAEFSETCDFNRTEWHDRTIGVVTSGIAYQYAREVFGDGASYLKLGFTNPLPKKLIADFASKVGTLYVIEELEPYLENHIRRLGITCIGKEKIPAVYELNPDIVARALLGTEPPVISCDTSVVPPRPPVLCAGCPHRGFFAELGKITTRLDAKRQKYMIAGDIGCYGLGGADPLNAMDLCICMGSAPSVGHGAQKVFNKFDANTRVIATLGDSTFFHTGIPALIDIVYNRSNTITCILDNRITGMTGQQDNPHTGFTLQGEPTKELSIEAVVRAVGVDHVRVINPMRLEEVDEALEEALRLDEPSVIITRWPCVLKKKTEEEKVEFRPYAECFRIDAEVCNGCGLCMQVGCPAISLDRATGRTRIDPIACNGCSVCEQTCNFGAIIRAERQHA